MEFEEKLQKIEERATKEADRIIENSRRESERHMDKLEASTKDLNQKSMQNFAHWRDYLHKYYVLILAFIGATGIFSSANDTVTPLIAYGSVLALGGIFVGFIAINVYFYLERRWLYIDNTLSATNPYKLYDHPEVEDDPMLAYKFNVRDDLKKVKQELKEARKNGAEKKHIRHLKTRIRAMKYEMGIIKYVGQQFFGFIEKIWIWSVVISFLLTSIGVVTIFISILFV